MGRFAVVLRARREPHGALAGKFPCHHSGHRLRLQAHQVAVCGGESIQPSNLLPAPQFDLLSIPIAFVQPKLCSARFRFCRLNA